LWPDFSDFNWRKSFSQLKTTALGRTRRGISLRFDRKSRQKKVFSFRKRFFSLGLFWGPFVCIIGKEKAESNAVKDRGFSMTRIMISTMAIAVMVCGVWGQTFWKRAYGGVYREFANAITPTPDGNFIIAGETYCAGILRDIFLLKIKPDGDTLWTKTYGGTGSEEAHAITPTPDGNFIVAGYTTSSGAGNGDVFLLKIKPNGDTLWTKTYGKAGSDGASAVTSTGDGNFIVAGYSVYSDTGWSKIFLLKINTDGDTLWTKTYGGTGHNEARAITATQDGNYFVTGVMYSGTDSYDTYLLKIKPDGDTVWTKTFRAAYQGFVFASTALSNGDFIIAAAGGGYSGICLQKVNPSGDTIWTKTYYGPYGSYEAAFSVTEAADGNCIVAGRLALLDVDLGHEDVFLMKINPDGDTLWTKSYGGQGDDRASAVIAASEGSYIVAGYTNAVVAKYTDVFLMSFIDDRYARKDSLFTYKLPVGNDSLNHGFWPLKVPAGMTVSLGGTLSWTPATDSSYTGHVEILVANDRGRQDTLTFNIFVNGNGRPTRAVNPVSRAVGPSSHDITVRRLSSKEVRFSLPAGASSLGIYDVRGQLLENISVRGNQATWLPRHGAGRYFAKAIWESRESVRGFTVVK
jgi:hypothetical protein